MENNPSDVNCELRDFQIKLNWISRNIKLKQTKDNNSDTQQFNNGKQRKNLHRSTNGSDEETEGVCVGESLPITRRRSGERWSIRRNVSSCEWTPPTPCGVPTSHNGGDVGDGEPPQRDLHLSHLYGLDNQGHLPPHTLRTHPL